MNSNWRIGLGRMPSQTSVKAPESDENTETEAMDRPDQMTNCVVTKIVTIDRVITE